MANPTIGTIDCHSCGDSGELRRCSTGQRLFYWMCACGKITPNLPTGQRAIYDRARFNDPEDKRQLGEYLKRKLPGFEQPDAGSRVEPSSEPEQNPEQEPERIRKPANEGGLMGWLMGGDDE